MTFNEFRLKYHNRDIGLFRAVAITLSEYRDIRVFSSQVRTPSDQYKEILQEIDRAKITPKIRLVTTHALRTGKEFANQITKWKQAPWKRPKPRTDIEAVVIFYYFSYVFKDATGCLDHSFGRQISSLLFDEGVIEKRRKLETAQGENELAATMNSGTSEKAAYVADKFEGASRRHPGLKFPDFLSELVSQFDFEDIYELDRLSDQLIAVARYNAEVPDDFWAQRIPGLLGHIRARKFSLEEVQAAVCVYYRCHRSVLKRKFAIKGKPSPRMISIYLLSILTMESPSSLGRQYELDRSGIQILFEKAKARYENDPEFKKDADAIKNELFEHRKKYPLKSESH